MVWKNINGHLTKEFEFNNFAIFCGSIFTISILP